MRPTIDHIRQLGDFATTYRWDMDMLFPALLSGGDAQKLNFRCESSALPTLKGESITVNIRGQKVKQHGIHSYENTLTLNFVETIDATMHEFIKKWRELLWETKSGKSKGNKAELQGTLTLRRLDNKDSPFWEYVLKGVYLESYELGGLDNNGDASKVSITVSFDYFEDKKLV